MAEVKVIEVQIKSNFDGATSGASKLKKGLKDVSTQAEETTENVSKMSKAEGVINTVGDAVGKLNPAFGAAIKSANGLILKMWEMAANPVGAILAGIVVTAKFLYEAFQSSVAGGKEIKTVFAAISAVGEQVKDAIFGLARALINVSTAAYKFITLDFKGAAEDIKKANKEAATSFEQLGDASDGTTFKIIKNIEKQKQANEKARKLQAVVQSETNKLLVQSREILTDETASINEKKKALEEVTKAEKASSAEKVRIAAKDLSLAKEAAAQMKGEAAKKMKGEIREATIALNEAETENAMTGIKLNKQRKMLLRQETSEAKEAADAKNEALKSQQEAEKTALKDRQDKAKQSFENEKLLVDEQLKNTKISIDEKRNIVLNDEKLSKADREKFLIDLHNQEIAQEEAHNQKIADLNKRYDDEKLNRLADTAVKKEELDYQRQVSDIEKLAQTELERQTLIEKLDVEHKARMGVARKTDSDKEIADAKAKEDKITADKKSAEDARKNINSIAIQSAQGLVSILAGLGEKNKKLQKAALIANGALSIAEIINNTNVGSAKEVATKGIFGLSTSAVLYAKMAVSIGSVIAATAKGLSALGGGTAPSSSGIGGGGGGVASAPPSFNVVGASATNQLAQTIGQKEQQPIKAYVVSNDVTTAQSLNRNIISSATLG
ncbi:MAG: hypothetical protein RL308_1641 [Bacteroidota bacterium]|jgi:hypothetical protein